MKSDAIGYVKLSGVHACMGANTHEKYTITLFLVSRFTDTLGLSL